MLRSIHKQIDQEFPEFSITAARILLLNGIERILKVRLLRLLQAGTVLILKLLEEIEPDSNIRRLDVDLLRCHMWLKRQEYRETMRAKSKLEKATGLTPDEEAYRDEIFKKIDETF